MFLRLYSGNLSIQAKLVIGGVSSVALIFFLSRTIYSSYNELQLFSERVQFRTNQFFTLQKMIRGVNEHVISAGSSFVSREMVRIAIDEFEASLTHPFSLDTLPTTNRVWPMYKATVVGYLGRRLEDVTGDEGLVTFGSLTSAADKFSQEVSDVLSQSKEAQRAHATLTIRTSFVGVGIGLFLLSFLFMGIYRAIGRDIVWIKSLTGKNARMEVELKTAKAVQEMLLPDPHLIIEKLKFKGHYQSASECGGDWWYCFQSGERVFLLVGDVVGHGVSAALITSAVRAQFSDKGAFLKKTTVEIAQATNALILEMTNGNQCMTMIIGCLDTRTYNFSYTNAGHGAWIRVSRNAKLDHMSDLQSMVSGPTPKLGAGSLAVFKERNVLLEPGDRLFMYTDGLFDIRSDKGELGKRNAYRLVLESLGMATEPEEIIPHLVQKLESYRGNNELIDDVTFVLAKVV